MMSKFLYSILCLFVFCMADFVHAETINGSAVATIKRQVYLSKMQQTDLGIILRDKWIKGKNISDKVRTNQFKVTGAPFSAVDISLKEARKNNITLLSDFVHDAGVSPQFNSSGALSFNVDGILDIGSRRPKGGYIGNYQITLNFQ